MIARPARNDIVLAVALLAGALASSVLYGVAGIFEHPAPAWATLPWALALTVPLAWRRVYPVASSLVVAAAFVVGGVVYVPELLVCNIALFLSIYSVGAWSPHRRRALIARVAITAGMLIWLLVALFIQATDPDALPNLPRAGGFSPMVAFMLMQLLTNVLYFAAAYYFGDRAWAAAQARTELERRTSDLEAERSRLTDQAVALDRVRIARELHDSVAHHVSVMGVQAAAARATLDSDPDASRTSLLHVEDTARTAIDELHRMLTTLREDGAPADVGGSVIGVTALPALVDASRESGIPTRLDVVGEPRPLPPAVSLNLYRIAQEALTNTRKHAGPDAEADVRLRYLDEAVELEIANTGVVLTRRSPGGLGQLGMRERVTASGGSLEIGPRSRGGYLVRARVPVPGAGA